MHAAPPKIVSVIKRLSAVSLCASAITGAAAPAFAAAPPTEATLASTSQALAFCQSNAMGSADIAYINGPNGVVQFGPKYNCAQMAATKSITPAITTAIRVDSTSGAISECKVAIPMGAVKLCNAGGIGKFDIAYILGGLYRTIGGQGYNCGIKVHKTVAIGAAICKAH